MPGSKDLALYRKKTYFSLGLGVGLWFQIDKQYAAFKLNGKAVFNGLVA